MDNILTAEHISKSFTNHRALDDVSVSVPRGQVYGLLGPNGAGKTTLIRIINHITAPDTGLVTFNGHPLTADDVTNIGYLPEERGLYKKMKVGEQALFFARLKGLSKAEATSRLREWFDRLEISDWWDKKVEELSKGMAQKVQFIVTVLHRPELLIFDEPFSGFDPINAGILKREILKLRDEGSTIIFSTHNMGSVEELCDNITLINRSRNILSGSVRDVREKFADNRYRITYQGDPAQLLEATDRLGAEAMVGETDKLGNLTATLSLAPGTGKRDMIAAVNGAVDLCTFEQVIPSMDDIFVAAVRASEKNVEVEPQN
jgi:ABC-2 type transport system ATP-binding protein